MSYFSERLSARARPSYAGVIRPGVRRLTKTAREHTRAKEILEIFNRADLGEMRFEEAQKEIEKRTGLANAMHPSNASYFSVFATDFTVPEHARMLVEKYGEDRGEGRRLYRFPVVFPTIDIDRILPGGFRRSKGDPAYFSTQGNDGVRYCTYHEHLSPDQIQDQRRRRIIQVRPEPKIRGQCDPGKCTEFAEGTCRFAGDLTFYIPGIPIGGLLKLTTGSEYASEAIYMELARIKEVLGTIPQVHPFDPGMPPFMMAKELQPRTYYDQRSGERKRAENWVPILVPAFDMGALVSGASPLLERPKTPQAWLAAPYPEATHKSQVLDATPSAPIALDPQGATSTSHDGPHGLMGVEPPIYDPADDAAATTPPGAVPMPQVTPSSDAQLGDFVDMTAPRVLAWVESLGGDAPALAVAKILGEMGNDVLQAHMSISEIVRSSGITKEQFQAYMTGRYGKGWGRNASVYKDALINLKSMQNDGSMQQTISAAIPQR